jgi:hypothetical protein
LRISRIKHGIHDKFFLGWKGADKGKFANIREELGEEITNGIINSSIFRIVGLGNATFETRSSVMATLVASGFLPFMAFSGENLVAQDLIQKTYYKIMRSPDIRFNPLVEVEKIAESLDEAFTFESKLAQFSIENKIEHYIVHEEPPTLLYLEKIKRNVN